MWRPAGIEFRRPADKRAAIGGLRVFKGQRHERGPGQTGQPDRDGRAGFVFLGSSEQALDRRAEDDAGWNRL